MYIQQKKLFLNYYNLTESNGLVCNDRHFERSREVITKENVCSRLRSN